MRIRSSLLLIAAAVFALAMAVFSTTVMAAVAPAPVKGAIFTTDQCGNFVNGNVYDAAASEFLPDDFVCPEQKGGYLTAPYLNGGPRLNAPCSAAGLPEGDYYFQVTDPSGKSLLSLDPIAKRKVHVGVSGLITIIDSTHQEGLAKTCSTTVTEADEPKSVELFPFKPTPNQGGEYKVWMTQDYVPGCFINDDPIVNKDSTQVCDGSFGFIPSKSKTDNFKVIDYDGDGIPDAEDACPDDPFNTCGGPGPIPE